MKTIKLFLSIMLVTGLNISAFAQTHDQNKTVKTAAITESFKVWGKCEMCKARIEKTAKVEGVTNASWDQKTQLLTVTYDPSKTGKDDLSKKLAEVGHDTEKYKATEAAYDKLPGCCHYNRN